MQCKCVPICNNLLYYKLERSCITYALHMHKLLQIVTLLQIGTQHSIHAMNIHIDV